MNSLKEGGEDGVAEAEDGVEVGVEVAEGTREEKDAVAADEEAAAAAGGEAGDAEGAAGAEPRGGPPLQRYRP